MKKFCGGLRQRVDNCSQIITESTCNSKPKFWTVVDGQTRYCEWNPSQEKCVYGDPCVCAKAPFTLDLFGTEHKSPTSCTVLTLDQCPYFQTRDNRNCISAIRTCMDPPKTDPQCTDFNEEDAYAAYSDSCPYGTTDSCSEICKNKDKSFTGPAREILSYECEDFGIRNGRYARYCMCSK